MCGAALHIEHTGSFARRVQTTSKLIKLLSNGSTLTAQNMPEATIEPRGAALRCHASPLAAVSSSSVYPRLYRQASVISWVALLVVR